MNLFRLLYDEDDGGGGTGPGAADKDLSGSANQKGDATDADQGGGKSDQAGVGDKDKAKGKDDPPDYQKLHKDLQTEHTSLQEKHDKLSKDVGRLGNDLGSYKKLQASLEGTPEEAKAVLQNLAKVQGLKINFGDQADPKLPTDFSDLTPENFQGYMDAHDEKLMTKMKATMAPALKVMQDTQLAAKHPDWVELSDGRSSLQKEIVSNRMSMDELLHLAVKAQNMPEALKAVGEKAVEDYRRSLDKKGGGGKGPSGTDGDAGEPKKGEVNSMKDPDTAKYMRARLRRSR